MTGYFGSKLIQRAMACSYGALLLGSVLPGSAVYRAALGEIYFRWFAVLPCVVVCNISFYPLTPVDLDSRRRQFRFHSLIINTPASYRGWVTAFATKAMGLIHFGWRLNMVFCILIDISPPTG